MSTHYVQNSDNKDNNSKITSYNGRFFVSRNNQKFSHNDITKSQLNHVKKDAKRTLFQLYGSYFFSDIMDPLTLNKVDESLTQVDEYSEYAIYCRRQDKEILLYLTLTDTISDNSLPKDQINEYLAKLFLNNKTDQHHSRISIIKAQLGKKEREIQQPRFSFDEIVELLRKSIFKYYSNEDEKLISYQHFTDLVIHEVNDHTILASEICIIEPNKFVKSSEIDQSKIKNLSEQMGYGPPVTILVVDETLIKFMRSNPQEPDTLNILEPGELQQTSYSYLRLQSDSITSNIEGEKGR